MNKKILPFDSTTPLKTSQDLLVLAQTYSLPTLSYIEITKQEQLAQMMKRWPLLSELAQSMPDLP